MIRMDLLCRQLSLGLDYVEHGVTGATDRHASRTAAMSSSIGKALGYDDKRLISLAVSALFHDNALTEYLQAEKFANMHGANFKLHCEIGEKNVLSLPLPHDASGFVLYHHECPNGTGLFKMRAGQYPEEAAIISFCDALDVGFAFGFRQHDFNDVATFVKHRAEGGYADAKIVAAFLDVFGGAAMSLQRLRDDNIMKLLDCVMPVWELSIDDASILRFAEISSRITDYKSHFTMTHTSGIADKALTMAARYGFSSTEKNALFLAASLHDIGKLQTPIEILEKPGKLNDDEFVIMKQHVSNTQNALNGIPGLEQISRWAGNHHEKLDGKGYPNKLCAGQLDFNSRLMTVLDIYQAVREPRPYHGQRSHTEAMAILLSMARRGELDEGIVSDVADEFAAY